MSFAQLDKLAAKANNPIADEWLESLQIAFCQHHNYYRFLYHLVATFKPAVSLEIGTWYGIGSAHMCAAANTYGGQVIGIDLNSHDMTERIIFDRFGNYHFLQMDSQSAGDIVKALIDKYGPLGIIFQDSSHHYNASRREWEIYSPMAHSPAVWICDDITPAFHDPQIDPPGKGMVQYFDELPGDKKYYRGLHYGNVMGVILL